MNEVKLKPKYYCPKCGEPLYREKSYPGFKPGPYLYCKNELCRGRTGNWGTAGYRPTERFDVLAPACEMLPSRFYNLRSKRPVRSD